MKRKLFVIYVIAIFISGVTLDR